MNGVLKYRIQKIDVRQFKIHKVHESSGLRLASTFQFKVNIEEEIICCVSKYEYKDSEDSGRIAMLLELECYFKVEPKCFKSLIKDSRLIVSPAMLQYMATIAVGAARGEIHARCEIAESPLQNLVLPPINLTKIINSPAEFDI